MTQSHRPTALWHHRAVRSSCSAPKHRQGAGSMAGSALAGDRLGRGVETNLQQQVLLTQGKGCGHTRTGPGTPGPALPGDEAQQENLALLCSSTAPAAATATGETARGDGGVRRKTQLHRDVLDGRNVPCGGASLEGHPSLTRVEGRGSCPKLLPAGAARQHRQG